MNNVQALRKIMKDRVLVKAKYCIKENDLARIITLETDLEGLGILLGFFSTNQAPRCCYYRS